MQRKNQDVKCAFVCEKHDDENLFALAQSGNVDELSAYLLQMNTEKIKTFFADSKKTRQLLDQFPSKKIAEDFTTNVLESKKLMPLVPVDFYTLVSLLPEKRQMTGLFSPQPVRLDAHAGHGLTRSVSLKK